MPSKIIFLFAFVSAAAFAHLQTGTYSGIQANGQNCQIQVTKVYYQNNTPHPLNERVDVLAQGIALTLQHPPIINAEKKMAYFNHDMFQGIIATQQGGMAVELRVAHARSTRDIALPAEFHLINHIYKNDVRTSLVCAQLKKTL